MEVRLKKKCSVCAKKTRDYTRCVECNLYICQDCSYYKSGCHQITCYDCGQKHIDRCEECRYETDTDCKDEESLICYVCDLAEQHMCTDCYRGICGLHVVWCKECEQKLCINCYPQSGICYHCIEYQKEIIQNKEKQEDEQLADHWQVNNPVDNSENDEEEKPEDSKPFQAHVDDEEEEMYVLYDQ